MLHPVVRSFAAAALFAALAIGAEPVPLSETHRATYDRARWLLSADDWAPFFAADSAGRDAFLAALFADPDSATAANELEDAIARRDALWRAELLSPLDERAGALFLLGRPASRTVPDCAETYRPLEIWTYGAGTLVFYEPEPRRGFRLWQPGLGATVLYTPRMAAWLDDWSDLVEQTQRVPGPRVDRLLCPQAAVVDRAIGASLRRSRAASAEEISAGRLALTPPVDRTAWAVAALGDAAPDAGSDLGPASLGFTFPATRGQRVVARLTVTLQTPQRLGRAAIGETSEPEASSGVGAGTSAGEPAGTVRQVHKIAVDGVIEKGDEIFEEFRVRFEIKPPAAEVPLALVVDRALRPAADYVVRLRVRDETGQGEARLVSGLVVPASAEPVAEVPVPAATIAELSSELGARSLAGGDGIALVPPEDDVVLGLWRAEAIVSGERIQKVVFLVDGKAQFTRSGAPWTAELRLPALPRETAIRVEGYDAAGALVAADDLVVNQPQGELAVRLVEPLPGRRAAAGERVTVRAELVVPEGRRIERVEFRLGDKVVASRAQPPWETKLSVPPGDLVYVSAVAILDDGRQAEAVRFLRAPANYEAVDVQFIELYTSVFDRSNRSVLDLEEAEFSVLEDGRRQRLARFGRVDDLPLTLGLVLDVSGSMSASLGEARAAAVGFLRNLVDPGDRCFALSFSDRPVVRMPRSDDPEAVAAALESLSADGSTALHDAVVQALYYFRGTRGQRALVLLSDGDDTSSAIPFRDALEFARRSGVAIYTIGLDLALTGFEARDKLKALAAETGGRAFFVRQASELAAVYAEIEKELRSQYLLAYVSDGDGADFRAVEVRVGRPGLKARTIRGYYP